MLICFVCSSCHAQTDKSLLENWQNHPISTNQDTLQKFNYSLDEWQVFSKNDTIRVVKYKHNTERSYLPTKIKLPEDNDSKMDISVLKVTDGFLIGFYRGEWGGYLCWYSADGKHHYKISDDEIVQFIKRDEKYYAIQGLAHLGMSEGSVVNIYKEGGRWKSKQYIKLPKAPAAICVDKNNDFIIITSESLLQIESTNKVTTLIENGLWSNGLYPNSVVIKNNILYSGMRAGIFKYNLSTHQQNWLSPY